MTFVRALAVLGWALPLAAQYGGPAILSRGEAPAAMTSPNISFRPFLEFTSTYETGLAGVAVDRSQGTLPDADSLGTQFTWGISGSHEWRHTRLGLSYRGSMSRYLDQSSFNSLSQSFLLGFTQQLTRHTTFTLRENAGIFTRAFGLGGLSQSVPFDPGQSYLPTTDFFDNRTYYMSTQGDVTYQKTARLSFNGGFDQFLSRYRASGLIGVDGLGAHGDIQYRLSRRNTIGTAYTFQHFTYEGQFGGADAHTFDLTFARALTSRLEFSGAFGMGRVEQKFIHNVPVDSIIAALLGVSETTEIAHFVSWIPTGRMRLSESFHHGVAYLSAGRSITPGNGLFTTSYLYNVSGGYTYTGLRRWSLSSLVSFDRGDSVGNFLGLYRSLAGGFSASREIAHSVHFVMGYDLRSYTSGDFRNYNRVVQEAHVGLGFTPGDVPLRVW